MKKLLTILAIGFLLVSCEEHERHMNLLNNAITVEDEFGYEYNIVTIEGCEYYRYADGRQFGLTKVDCDCEPDKSKR